MGVAGFLRLNFQETRTQAGGGFAARSSSTYVWRQAVTRRAKVLVRCSTNDDYNSWRKKAFGSKPDYPGSTKFPRKQDPIDLEWQELQRGRSLNPEAGEPSTSGRPDISGNYNFSIEETWETADDTYTPFPGPLNAGESFAVNQWPVNGRSLAASSELWSRVSQVFVILFGVGKTETEGIYSLRAVTGNEGLPIDTIIAFESSEDAERYAGLLEATMARHVPRVCPIESRELLDFCADSGYNCRLEPSGSLLMPPEYNVGMTDWERSLRLRDGKFDVLKVDPDLAGLGEARDALQQPYEGPTLMNQAGAYFPADSQELEELKARLERLLP